MPRFTHAALAYEGVGGKYRAVFAEPKGSTRTSNSTTTDRASSRHEDYNMVSSYGSGGGGGGGGSGSTSGTSANNNFTSNHSSRLYDSAFLNSSANSSKINFTGNLPGNNGTNSEVQLNVIVSSTVNQDQLWRLFDIVPGLEYCHITGECNRNSNYATAAYNSLDAAQYARYVQMDNNRPFAY